MCFMCDSRPRILRAIQLYTCMHAILHVRDPTCVSLRCSHRAHTVNGKKSKVENRKVEKHSVVESETAKAQSVLCLVQLRRFLAIHGQF